MRRVLAAAALALMGAASAAEDAARYEVRGLVEPHHEATLSAEIAARVAAMPLQEGERFGTDDLLVRLDCSLYEAHQAAATADLEKARRKLANDRQLAELGSIGDLEVALAEAEVARARAELRHRRVYVERCTVRAPFPGRVVERAVEPHEGVAPGDPLLSILDDRDLRLRVIVPSAWLGWLRPGVSGEALVDETGARHAVTVERLGARIDAVSQSLPVTVRIDAPPDAVLAGMSATVRFTPPGE